jgi:hypothetical protein
MEPDNLLASLGQFPIPTQSVTIIADVQRIDGQGDLDGFGLGCRSFNDRGYLAVVYPGGEVVVLAVAPPGEQSEVLLMDQEVEMPAQGELQQVAIACSVESTGQASVAVAVNGEERARLTHSEEAITTFTAVELAFSSRPGSRWTMDIDSVEAHEPRPDDPAVP